MEQFHKKEKKKKSENAVCQYSNDYFPNAQRITVSSSGAAAF